MLLKHAVCSHRLWRVLILRGKSTGVSRTTKNQYWWHFKQNIRQKSANDLRLNRKHSILMISGALWITGPNALKNRTIIWKNKTKNNPCVITLSKQASIKIAFFFLTIFFLWCLTACRRVCRHQRFGETCCLIRQTWRWRKYVSMKHYLDSAFVFS